MKLIFESKELRTFISSLLVRSNFQHGYFIHNSKHLWKMTLDTWFEIQEKSF